MRGVFKEVPDVPDPCGAGRPGYRHRKVAAKRQTRGLKWLSQSLVAYHLFIYMFSLTVSSNDQDATGVIYLSACDRPHGPLGIACPSNEPLAKIATEITESLGSYVRSDEQAASGASKPPVIGIPAYPTLTDCNTRECGAAG